LFETCTFSGDKEFGPKLRYRTLENFEREMELGFYELSFGFI